MMSTVFAGVALAVRNFMECSLCAAARATGQVEVQEHLVEAHIVIWVVLEKLKERVFHRSTGYYLWVLVVKG